MSDVNVNTCCMYVGFIKMSVDPLRRDGTDTPINLNVLRIPECCSYKSILGK